MANRADDSISVLSIAGTDVTRIDTVDMGEQVAHVAFTPDGRRALAVKFAAHKVAVLEVDGQRVTDTRQDMPVGLWPYNIAVTPDGRLALTADNGNAGVSDGHVDTVSVIDLEAAPPRVVDRVVVGDAPEGLAISPTGEIAVALLLRGSGGVAEDAWFRHDGGSVVVLEIGDKTVSRVGEVVVGGMPEGAVFSPGRPWCDAGLSPRAASVPPCPAAGRDVRRSRPVRRRCPRARRAPGRSRPGC